MTISRHPEPWTDPHPLSSESGRAFVFSPFETPDGFTRRQPRRVRSLFTRPCRSFRSAFAERIRDRTSPTDFCNYCDVRATKPELLILAGTEASTSFLFLRAHAASLAGAMNTRQAALRPLMSTPVLVPPT